MGRIYTGKSDAAEVMHSGDAGVIWCMRAVRFVAASSAVCLVVLLLYAIAPPNYSSLETGATTGTANTSTLTFSSTNDTASATLAVGSVGGTFATSTEEQKARFLVSTDNYTGYTLTIKSGDGGTALTNGAGSNTPTIDSISSSTTATGFAVNSWGYMPNYYDASGTSPEENTTMYYPAPTSGGATLRTTTAANSTPHEYTIALGLKADFTNPSGIYTSDTFVLEYIANPVAYTITFADDTGDTSVANLPSSLSGDTTTTSVVLTNDNTPTRIGYTFAGKWCLGSTTTNGTVCDGTEYVVGDSFDLDQTVANDPTLYAVWLYGPFDVVVNFTGVGVASVEFSAAGHETQVVSTSGGTASLDYNVAYSVTMSMTSADYVFGSWALNSASYGTLSSTSRNPATFTTNARSISARITARGKDRPRIITYKANGGEGDDYTQEIDSEGSDYLKGNHFTKTVGTDDYYFKGWTITEGGTTLDYNAGQLIPAPSSDLTLYAVWAKGTGTKLYDVVSSLTKGLQLNTDDATMGFKSSITMNNSGVYTYNSDVFGTPSDAGDNAVYYYRGVLDDNLDGTNNTYGSDGNSANYPNYVKLGTGSTATCWRIVRTTGSRGVKMIYNGIYGNTTEGSCANSYQSAYSGTLSWVPLNSVLSRNILSVGYTYNPTYADASATTAVEIGILFGTSADYSANTTNSSVKNYLEGSFYSGYLSSYTTTELEESAGYCSDRSIGPSGSTDWTEALSETTTLVPYGTGGMGLRYFGGYVRTHSTATTLTCQRGSVDLYSVSGASTGNGQLAKPVALLTADEVAFAGSGGNKVGGYNSNSYLRDGSNWWLLSPAYRDGNGSTGMGTAQTVQYGIVGAGTTINGHGIRPVVSLTAAATVASGNGTVTDPWVIEW